MNVRMVTAVYTVSSHITSLHRTADYFLITAQAKMIYSLIFKQKTQDMQTAAN